MPQRKKSSDYVNTLWSFEPSGLFVLKIALLVLLSFSNLALASDGPTIVDAEIGIGGAFKLGLAAPVIVTIEGGDIAQTLDVEIIASDSEGFGVLTKPIDGKPIRVEPGKTSSLLLYTRIGKSSMPVVVRLLENKRLVAKKTINQYDNSGKEIYRIVGSDSRLMIELGKSCSLQSLLRLSRYENQERHLTINQVDSIESMPLDWIGYEGVDQVWLTVGDGKWAKNLTPEGPRIQALKQWIETGGKLVLSCGSQGQEMFSKNGPLVPLLPGKFVDLKALRQTDVIEVYCGAKQPIPLSGGSLTVARIQTDPRTIELSAGTGDNQLPLVIRKSFGFGEVTFVGFDLNSIALNKWQEKNKLLDRLESAQYEGLGGSAQLATKQSHLNSYLSGHSGLINSMFSTLDRSFGGITVTPFIAIVGLIILYLLLIGPGDYWLTSIWLKRPEVTWITFPLIVAATSAGAYYSAITLKGDQLITNQIEIVDIDTEANQGRGLILSHMFTPNAGRFNIAYQTQQANGQPIANATSYTSWLGKPGYGLGAMQGGGVNAVTLRADYYSQMLTPEGNTKPSAFVSGMPVQVWSTRSLMHRWQGEVGDSLDADLTWNQDRLVEGSITNEFGIKLQDCYLLAGDWAWRLGTLNNGETTSIDNSLSPIKIKTLLKSFDKDQDIDHLLNKLSLIGSGSNDFGNRLGSHLAFCDLSHYLANGGALLLAKSSSAEPSVILESGKPLENENDKHWQHYRFLIKVEE